MGRFVLSSGVFFSRGPSLFRWRGASGRVSASCRFFLRWAVLVQRHSGRCTGRPVLFSLCADRRGTFGRLNFRGERGGHRSILERRAFSGRCPWALHHWALLVG